MNTKVESDIGQQINVEDVLPFQKGVIMKNDLNSLNNYLFEELERLNDDETLDKDENLQKELKRAKAISGISTSIVNNAKLILDAKKYADEVGVSNESEVLRLNEKN